LVSVATPPPVPGQPSPPALERLRRCHAVITTPFSYLSGWPSWRESSGLGRDRARFLISPAGDWSERRRNPPAIWRVYGSGR
jgi:hypothetical protein